MSLAACGEVSDTELATTREWGYDHKGLYHGHYVGANCTRSASGKSRKLRMSLSDYRAQHMSETDAPQMQPQMM